MRAPTDAVSHDRVLGCVGDVDWAPERADYGAAVRARVNGKKEEREGLYGRSYRQAGMAKMGSGHVELRNQRISKAFDC